MFSSTQNLLHNNTTTSSHSLSPSPSNSHPTKPLAKGAGRWTKEEHQRFIEGLKKYGKNWKQIEEYVGTRSGAQIRSHAQKFFNRLERELNLRIDGSKSQISQQITESLRKMSEVSGSTVSTLLHEAGDDNRTEEVTPLATNVTETNVQPSVQAADLESPGDKTVFFQETQSVPSGSPKLAPLEEVTSFRRNVRKMSEDVIVKQSISMFEVFMSKIRTSKNGIDFPKLSDLVDMSFGAHTSFRPFVGGNKGLSSGKRLGENSGFSLFENKNVSFRVNPRKVSEDNILISTNLGQLRKSSDVSEFELFSKKIKN